MATDPYAYSTLIDLALAKLKTLDSGASFVWSNTLDPTKIATRTVLLTPGSQPLDFPALTRGGRERDAQLAVTVLDKALPGTTTTINSDVDFLVQIADAFDCGQFGQWKCNGIDFPLLCDPELVNQGCYQGVVNLHFICYAKKA